MKVEGCDKKKGEKLTPLALVFFTVPFQWQRSNRSSSEESPCMKS